VGRHIITLRTPLSQFTMPPTQTTRTNHLGYDVGSSRKIPDGALARVATAECLKANQYNALTRFALTLFRLLCFGFGMVKAALKATTRPADRGGAPPAFQLQVNRYCILYRIVTAYFSANCYTYSSYLLGCTRCQLYRLSAYRRA